MEVNRLLGEELSYELRIRGLPIGNTVVEKRAALREALRLERAGLAHAPVTVDLDPQDEFDICRDKLASINNDIKNFDYQNRENEFKRLKSRLIHITLRLDRLTFTTGVLQTIKNNLLTQCSNLSTELNHVHEGLITHQKPINATEISHIPMQATSHISILDTENPLLPEVLHSVQPSAVPTTVSFDLIDLPTVTNNPANKFTSTLTQVRLPNETREGDHFSRLATIDSTIPNIHSRTDPYLNLASRLENFQFSPINPPLQSDRLGDCGYYGPRYFDISRWNLRYDGRSSVNDFLERVEEIRFSRGVSKDQLLQPQNYLPKTLCSGIAPNTFRRGMN